MEGKAIFKLLNCTHFFTIAAFSNLYTFIFRLWFFPIGCSIAFVKMEKLYNKI